MRVGQDMKVRSALARPIALFREVPSFADLLISQGLPLVGLAVIGFYTAGALGPSGKGVAGFALAVASLGGATFFMSLHIGVVAAYHDGIRGIALPSALIALVFGSTPLGVAFAFHAASLGPGATQRQQAIFLGLAAVGVEAASLVILRTIQGIGYARTYRRFVTAKVCLYGVGVALFSVLGLTPSEVVLSFLVSSLVVLVWSIRLSRRLLRARVPLPRLAGRLEVRRYCRRSLAAHFAVLSQQASYRADVILLGLLASSYSVGQYVVATAIAETLWLVAEAVSLSVYSETARLARDPSGEVKVILSRGLKVTGLISLGGSVVLATTTYPFLRLIFPAYTPAYPLVLLLLPGIVIGGGVRVITYSAIASHRTALVGRVAWCSILLVPVYVPGVMIAGAAGAALASDIIYGTLFASLVYFEARMS